MKGFCGGLCTCSGQGEGEEDEDGAPPPRSLASVDREGKQENSIQSLTEDGQLIPQCRICFQGSEKGELVSPCRCDGTVRYTHEACLIRWISEKGSWTCELCDFEYRAYSLCTKNPLQWQAVSLSIIERVQISATILCIVFLLTSVAWILWSLLSSSARWQRQDFIFQICYGMYGFMDLVCAGLLIHEGPAVIQILKRWLTINHHWKVLDYEKEKDSVLAACGDVAGSEETADDGQEETKRVKTSLMQRFSNTISNVLHQLRPNNRDNDNGNTNTNTNTNNNANADVIDNDDNDDNEDIVVTVTTI
ncbi:E3 ubiquitin-protein ligase MARCHF9-like [Dunckerocampus dactyliophorus]|uniref:E3 ubiquitin-protein ligase MARCHF9-like n=1 Tax=Dunckerocampus dactyliophorus TaxID=161453 RepID=UPI00240596DB|nr:E3 ubiquitin-protein ligase MARCHF9-like [Dunckerocampus dactyliophorus]